MTVNKDRVKISLAVFGNHLETSEKNKTIGNFLSFELCDNNFKYSGALSQDDKGKKIILPCCFFIS